MSCLTLVSRSARPDVAAEVLADDDVGGQLRPEVGDLDVLLLEDALAGLVGDAGGPQLPGDLVVGMDARAGVAALEGQALDPGLAIRLRAVEGGAPGTGVAAGVLGLGAGRGGGGGAVSRCRRRCWGPASSFRSRMPCWRCLGPSVPLLLRRPHRRLSSLSTSPRSPPRAICGSCRILASSWMPRGSWGPRPGRRTGESRGLGRAGGSERWSVSERSGDPKNVTPMGDPSQARKHNM